MSTPQKHIINQFSVDLSVSSEEEAFVLRKEMNEVLQNEITAVIDELCSQYSTSEETLKIERLEIDLGTIQVHDFKKNWIENFRQSFENQLYKASILNSESHKKINKEQSNFEILTNFLLTGQLDWWVISEDFNLHEIFEEIIQNQAAFLKDFLINNSHKQQIGERILFQFSEKLILQFLENIQIDFLEYGGILQGLFKRNFKFKPTVFDLKKLPENKKNFREVILYSHFYKFPKQINGISIYNDILENLEKFKLRIIFRALFKHKFRIISKEEICFTLVQIIQEEWNIADKNALEILHDIFPNYQQTNESNNLENEAFIEKKTSKITLQNAGIVLIVPYFKHFFQELQLIENQKFISKKAQFKAIHLIKYLATGKTEFDEFDLTLEKLICGVSLNEPVPRKVELFEREIAEADELLKSVIEHWQVLKNSSPDALRNTFFQREGILQKNELGWQVNIERKTQDILFDSIPWGFSMIVPSWNNYIITVEW